MQFRLVAAKYLTRNIIAIRLEHLRRQQQRIVCTCGGFDLLHAGHVRFLQEARSLGDCLIVAINSDAQLRSLKGPDRPVLGADERASILAALACVDYVCVFDEPTPHELLRELEPDLLVKGGDYGGEGAIGREIVQAYGGEVRTLSLAPGISTSEIIRRIKQEKA